MELNSKIPGYKNMLSFTLIESLLGRRSRRFFQGAEIPDGVFQYRSRFPSFPLNENEKMLVLAACGSNTSFNHLIYRAKIYAPHLSNYAGSAGGRTFPSSAGFHTSKTFFTDDEGVYFVDVRDVPSFQQRNEEGALDLDPLVEEMKKHIKKIKDGRLSLPPTTPFVEAHNTWVVNHPGTLLIFPVGDLAQHVLLNLCYLLQNGYVITDDINKKSIPGIEAFKQITSLDNPWPLSFVEQWSLSELTAELSTSCYAGTLMLQAMGLGGWMFNGIDPLSVLGASGDENVQGLGFQYEKKEKWAYPNIIGTKGIMEAYCPPWFQNMYEAVEALSQRKFGPGGPFHPDTPGPWKDSPKVRSSAKSYNSGFKECVAHQAQYIFDTFGKFPGTVPSLFVMQFLQAHHLDLEFYDNFYKPGAYLKTHSDHMKDWHHV